MQHWGVGDVLLCIICSSKTARTTCKIDEAWIGLITVKTECFLISTALKVWTVMHPYWIQKRTAEKVKKCAKGLSENATDQSCFVKPECASYQDILENNYSHSGIVQLFSYLRLIPRKRLVFQTHSPTRTTWTSWYHLVMTATYTIPIQWDQLKYKNW